jgi:mannose-1-phosphate guanylyltransferase/phosphomannomutase
MDIETDIALIMAGGRGERMRASGNTVPKPLVPVCGVPLLERNLVTLLEAGFRHIYVSVSQQLPEVGRFVETWGVALAGAANASVRCLTESEPLGNIGAAAELGGVSQPILVVFADNLIALDLAALLVHHTRSKAALTVATHVEPFRIPYGEVVIVDGRITAYLEKPERRIPVSSGTYVLGPEAVAILPRGQRADIAWLVEGLLARGSLVVSFPHKNSWIDVNDAASLQRAEELVAAQPDIFAQRPRVRKALR